MTTSTLKAMTRFGFALIGLAGTAGVAAADPNYPSWMESSMNTGYGNANQMNQPAGNPWNGGGQQFSGGNAAGGQANQVYNQAMQMLQVNPRGAAQLLEQAARMGHPHAMLSLGVMNFNGEGVPPNPVEAFVWYTCAAQAGVPQGQQYAADAARMLNPQQRAAAEQKVRQILGGAGRGTSGGAANGMPRPNGPGGNLVSSGEVELGGWGTTPEGHRQKEESWQQMQQQKYGSLPPNGVMPQGPGGMRPPTGQPGGTAGATVGGTELWDLGFFKMRKPQGWEMTTAGQGVGFCFLGHDPSRPTRQLFQFGSVGPIFPSAADKQAFTQLLQFSNDPQMQAVASHPVITPFEPATFLQAFGQIARLPHVQQFFPKVPVLDNVQIVAREPLPPQYTQMMPGAKGELLRARFTLNGEPCEGVFSVVTSIVAGSPQMGVAGTGMAYCFTGAIAPAGELAQFEPLLVSCLKSGQFSREYMQAQANAHRSAMDGLRKRGEINRRTNEDISRMNRESWDYQSRSFDIGTQMNSDWIRETERVYNPDTGEVMEFDYGFYENYDLNRNQFEMNNLEAVPYNQQNYDRLMQPTINGYNEIR